jgi:uncharacterized protein (DUF1778 family)
VPILLDSRARDGTRLFGELPQTALQDKVRDHVASLPGATLTDFVFDGVTEAWIDFTFRGQQVSINDQLGQYLFFVDDPAAPDEALREVLAHFEKLLGPPRRKA